ncbi:hypothetical protein ADIS_0015 [Lunatimonas lonarensis]|uniref:Uncharacterized protein n=1 Tax=Lunatimonas lonarensis TaxID=1232681 RepID=R7ZZH3_9BACT|nr:hypothetical protein ADIS_0015 [Lunatimonas lonarensis]
MNCFMPYKLSILFININTLVSKNPSKIHKRLFQKTEGQPLPTFL